MKKELLSLRKWIILIVIAIFIFFIVNNFSLIIDLFNGFIDIMYPFILGAGFAFILNIPMRKIEGLFNRGKKIKSKKLIRGLSIVISLLILLLVIVFVAFLLIPELVDNMKVLIGNVPSLIDKVEDFILRLLEKYPEIQNDISSNFNKSTDTGKVISDLINYVINGAIDFVSNLVSGVVTVFTSLVFAVYMLINKEYLGRGIKKIAYAYLDGKLVEKIFRIGKLTNNTFSKFISGQCLDAVILGLIFFFILSIFRFPYALLISVLTTVTALIPIFGALIAMVIGAILIAITNPLQAIVFMILFLVIQQIEGNFIYPKVVGTSVGLSPLWTLMAISIFGGLFGVFGMFIGIPIVSVLYSLIRADALSKINRKKLIID